MNIICQPDQFQVSQLHVITDPTSDRSSWLSISLLKSPQYFCSWAGVGKNLTAAVKCRQLITKVTWYNWDLLSCCHSVPITRTCTTAHFFQCKIRPKTNTQGSPASCHSISSLGFRLQSQHPATHLITEVSTPLWLLQGLRGKINTRTAQVAPELTGCDDTI